VREAIARGEQATALMLALETDLALPGDSAAEKLLREARRGPPPQNL
jgi:hypothetical protein